MGRLGANRRSMKDMWGRVGANCQRANGRVVVFHSPMIWASESPWIWIKRLHGVILDLWVNILSWRVILQIFSNLACGRLISDPRAASSPYHGRAYPDRRIARVVAPLEI